MVPSDFLTYSLKIKEEFRGFFEIIPGNKMEKIYFDIDDKDEVGTNLEKVLQDFILICLNYFKAVLRTTP